MNDYFAKILELVESIQRDETGTLIAGQFMGGNGGLLSRKSLALADEVHKLTLEVQREIEAANEPSHQTDR